MKKTDTMKVIYKTEIFTVKLQKKGKDYFKKSKVMIKVIVSK